MLSNSFLNLLRYILPIWDEWHQMQVLRVKPQRCLQQVMVCPAQCPSLNSSDKNELFSNSLSSTRTQQQTELSAQSPPAMISNGLGASKVLGPHHAKQEL